jgi:hypothetical protein
LILSGCRFSAHLCPAYQSSPAGSPSLLSSQTNPASVSVPTICLRDFSSVSLHEINTPSIVHQGAFITRVFRYFLPRYGLQTGTQCTNIFPLGISWAKSST